MKLPAVLLALALTACGVPNDPGPRPLPTGTSSPVATPSEGGQETPFEQEITLWFVRGGALVPAVRTTTGPITTQSLIDLLSQGPTPKEQAQGIRSAINSVVSGKPLVVTAAKAGVPHEDPPNQVAVVIEPEFKDLLSQEQVLILGEVVISVAVGGIEKVLFIDDDGQVLGVPTADGRLANGPVTPDDYSSLIAPPQ